MVNPPPKRTVLAVVCAGVVVAGALGFHSACSYGRQVASGTDVAGDSGSGEDSDSDNQAGSGTDGGHEASDWACETEEALGPPGWKLNRDWSCRCRMFDPEPGTKLPEWGKWEKCPALGPKNVDCRVIVPPEGIAVGSFGASMDVDEETGRLRLAVEFASRTPHETYNVNALVFDPDGPTLNAMSFRRSLHGGCDVSLKHTNQGKLAIAVGGKDDREELDFGLQAVLCGDVNGSMSKLVYNGILRRLMAGCCLRLCRRVCS